MAARVVTTVCAVSTIASIPAAAAPIGSEPPAPPEAAAYCQIGTQPIKGLATTEKVVTFTFDDGPSATHTRQVMDVFEQYGHRATFFMIASASRRQEALLREVVARGFEIGNHSSRHSTSSAQNIKEIAAANRLFERYAGVIPIFYRAPGLAWSRGIVRTVAANHMCPIDTTTYIQDWKRASSTPASVLCDRFRAQLVPGAIVILHAGGHHHGETVKALPCMLDFAEAQGYRVLSMREFLAIGGGAAAHYVVRPRGPQSGRAE